VLAAIDDTLFTRTGRKVHAIGWFHDRSAKGPAKWGGVTTGVICAIVVRLPFLSRPVALPVAGSMTWNSSKCRLTSTSRQPSVGCKLIESQASAGRFP